MKTFELTRPIGGPYFNFDELVQDTQRVAAVLAENITEAIEKLQKEECITMHIVSVNEKTNIADVDIPLRNNNSGWGMGYIEEVKK